MELKKITISIPIMLYQKALKDAELKGYEDFDEFIINLIRYEVFSIKKEIPCKEPIEHEFTGLSNEEIKDLEEDDTTYSSHEIQRDLDSRGFGQ